MVEIKCKMVQYVSQCTLRSVFAELFGNACLQDQYMFIHDVLVEYLVGGGQTEVTQDSVVNYVALLTAVANGVAAQQKIPDASSTLEKQFKVYL